MPVPKYRTSASKRDMRRSHHALKAPGLSVCPNCNDVKLPHAACSACGHYKGKQVLDVKQATPNWDAAPAETNSTKAPEKTK